MSVLSVSVADVDHRLHVQSLVESILVLCLASSLKCWSMPLCDAPHLRSSSRVFPMCPRELDLLVGRGGLQESCHIFCCLGLLIG